MPTSIHIFKTGVCGALTEFVWEKEQSSKLIDSILKGFPIGTFIFWKTKEELRSYKEVGNHKLPETDKGDYVQYILDGQQRIDQRCEAVLRLLRPKTGHTEKSRATGLEKSPQQPTVCTPWDAPNMCHNWAHAVGFPIRRPGKRLASTWGDGSARKQSPAN